MWRAAAPEPDRATLALTAGLVPDTRRVALAAPLATGVYATVTQHDLPGPRAVPVHVLAVMAKAAAPVRATVSAAVALPPVFVSVNVFEAVAPTCSSP